MEHDLLHRPTLLPSGEGLGKIRSRSPAMGPGPCGGKVVLVGGCAFTHLCWVTTAHLKPESFKAHCIINRIYVKWAALCSS